MIAAVPKPFVSWLTLAALLAACATVSAASPPPPAIAPADAVTISLARDLPEVRAYAGEPMALRITLTNTTAGALMIPDWDHFADEVALRARITGYPGESGPPEDASGFWDTATFQKGDFRPLPPGQTVIVRSIVPMLPGKARITVGFHGPTDVYVSLTDGRRMRLEHGWTGHIYAGLSADIPDEMSPEMKKRYDDVRERIADPLVPAEQKGYFVAQVAAEKHYFAARFVRELCDKVPAGRMRDMAILELLKLAKVGTAYESVPALLGWMVDPKTDQDIRVGILDWAADALAHKGRVVIADQAFYTWPDAVQKDAREQLQKLTKDSNPYFALHAKDALKRVTEATAAKP